MVRLLSYGFRVVVPLIHLFLLVIAPPPPPLLFVFLLPPPALLLLCPLPPICVSIACLAAAGLGEHRIRELNDEINLTLRRKRAWERQIRDLGGPNHMASGRIQMELEGFQVPGGNGYMYFGAAKDLPGVRELFEAVRAMLRAILLSPP